MAETNFDGLNASLMLKTITINESCPSRGKTVNLPSDWRLLFIGIQVWNEGYATTAVITREQLNPSGNRTFRYGWLNNGDKMGVSLDITSDGLTLVFDELHQYGNLNDGHVTIQYI